MNVGCTVDFVQFWKLTDENSNIPQQARYNRIRHGVVERFVLQCVIPKPTSLLQFHDSRHCLICTAARANR
jgi:hypothetical protein